MNTRMMFARAEEECCHCGSVANSNVANIQQVSAQERRDNGHRHLTLDFSAAVLVYCAQSH